MGLSVAVQPAPSGVLGVVKTFDARAAARAEAERLATLRRALVRDDAGGHFLPRRAALRLEVMDSASKRRWRQELLAWLRDHVHSGIPRWYYQMVLGHDLHLSTYAELHVKHWHATERDPFEPDKVGWLENVGLVSVGKVTVAFRDFVVDQLIAETSAFGDFKYHEVGTDNTAEANSQTALIATSGIARVAGTQVEAAADQYRSVATVTADASETWQEHGIFNASSAGTMMDRSLISPTVAVVASDTVQFTYTLTCNAES